MSAIDLKALRASVERVKAYLDRRDAARGLDIEHIHGFDLGPNGGVELLASDLRALLKLADLAQSQQPVAAPVSGDVALPELPDPTIEGSAYHPEHKICYMALIHFTAEQMRTYGQQCSDAALERVIAGLTGVRRYEESEMEGGGVYPDTNGAYVKLQDALSAIRALKGGEA